QYSRFKAFLFNQFQHVECIVKWHNPIFGNSSSLIPQPDWNSLCSYNSFQPSATFDKDLQAIDIDNDLLRFKTRELHENDMLMSPPS
ncbi:paired mesoderm homeobox protein 2-like, partial [Aphis craccivora]